MSATLRWYGPQFKVFLNKVTSDGLQRAAVFFHGQCRRAVNKSNLRGTAPSQPGEPPRLYRGFGRDNIVWEHDATIPAARIGVARPGIYMLMLEIGTRFIRPRPWLIATLLRWRDTIGRLAASGGKP